MASKHCPDPRTSVVEHGERFETGRPVTVRFVRGTSPAPKPTPDDRFQQRIEPAGRYMVHNPDPGRLPQGWERGVVRFENPLVVPLNASPSGAIYDEHSWKHNVSREFGGKTGKALSRAIAKKGHDAVVTVTLDSKCKPIDTREIVDLTMFRGSAPAARHERGENPRTARASRAPVNAPRTRSDLALKRRVDDVLGRKRGARA